jgi:uncharacterized protein (DUF1778 family)
MAKKNAAAPKITTEVEISEPGRIGVHVWLSAEHKALIEKAAEREVLKTAVFMRKVAVEAARKIVEGG